MIGRATSRCSPKAPRGRQRCPDQTLGRAVQISDLQNSYADQVEVLDNSNILPPGVGSHSASAQISRPRRRLDSGWSKLPSRKAIPGRLSWRAMTSKWLPLPPKANNTWVSRYLRNAQLLGWWADLCRGRFAYRLGSGPHDRAVICACSVLTLVELPVCDHLVDR
jgi:hypothetical protein